MADKNRTEGKPLSALLQILRSNGVTRYETPALKLELGAAPRKQTPTAINVSPEALDEEAHGELDDDEEGDPRFLLEKLSKRIIKRPDPRRNPQ